MEHLAVFYGTAGALGTVLAPWAEGSFLSPNVVYHVSCSDYFGSPHTGTIVGCATIMNDKVDRWGFTVGHGVVQGDQMCPFSGFVRWLQNDAKLPQAKGPSGDAVTEWSVIGATGRALMDFCCLPRTGDNFIHWESATGLFQAPHRYLYINPKYSHPGYYQEAQDINDADIDWWGPDVNGRSPKHSHTEDGPRFRLVVFREATSIG